MKYYKIAMAPFLIFWAFYFIYRGTGSFLFTFIWTLACIFGIYNLERFFKNKKVYLITTGIVFGIFFGSALFVFNHSLVGENLVYTFNIFIPSVTYTSFFKSLKEQEA